MAYEDMEYEGFLQYLWEITHEYSEEELFLPWFTTEEDIRKACELPVRKKLVFYKTRHGESVGVKQYRPAQCGVFEVFCDDNTLHLVHRDYFRHMQKPTFLKDMAEEEKTL